MKRPDLLLLIAIWEFTTAFGALIGISAIAVFVFPDAIDSSLGSAIPGTIFGISISILVLLCYVGIAIAGSTGLLQGREWGRVLSITHAALSLFGFPIGTVIGVLSIVYLTRHEVTNFIQANKAEQQPR